MPFRPRHDTPVAPRAVTAVSPFASMVWMDGYQTTYQDRKAVRVKLYPLCFSLRPREAGWRVPCAKSRKICCASILGGRIRDIRNRHRLRRCRLHQGREGGSLKTARSAAQRPTGEASDAAQRNSYTHNFAGQRSECMLHEVGLSTQHEPQ